RGAADALGRRHLGIKRLKLAWSAVLEQEDDGPAGQRRPGPGRRARPEELRERQPTQPQGANAEEVAPAARSRSWIASREHVPASGKDAPVGLAERLFRAYVPAEACHSRR